MYPESFSVAAHFSRQVKAEFSAGQVSSDGGALLLREVDGRINLLGRLAACFSDRRSPLFIQHHMPQMLSQRIYGLALGYEDLNDHEQLRSDPLLAVLSGKRKLEEPLAGGANSLEHLENWRCQACTCLANLSPDTRRNHDGAESPA